MKKPRTSYHHGSDLYASAISSADLPLWVWTSSSVADSGSVAALLGWSDVMAFGEGSEVVVVCAVWDSLGAAITASECVSEPRN